MLGVEYNFFYLRCFCLILVDMQMFGGSSAGPPGRFLPEGSQFSEFSNQKGSRSCSEEEEDREVSSSLLVIIMSLLVFFGN